MADGDSITANSGNFNDAAHYTYRFFDEGLALLSNSYIYKNVAVGGKSCDQMITTGPAFVDTWFNPARKKNIAFIYCGINDYAIEGHSVGQIETDLQTYVTARKNKGWTTMVATYTDNGYMSNADRATLNTFITSTLTNADFIVRFDTDPRMGADGSHSSSTLCGGNPCFIDGTHPTSVTGGVCPLATSDGNCSLAFDLKTALLAAGLN